MTIDAIREHEYILTPGRYVGRSPSLSRGEEKMQRLTEKLAEEFAKGEHLEEKIKENLNGIGFECKLTYLDSARQANREEAGL